jgi:hypothetical protein
MLKIALRLFAILLLLIIIVMDDFPFYNKMKDATTQLFLALFVICCIYYDTTFGFILGLVLMVIYYEIYKKIKKQIVSTTAPRNPDAPVIENMTDAQDMNSVSDDTLNSLESSKKAYQSCGQDIKLNYISEEHLLAAQNNIWDSENYAKEIKGIDKGFNNEEVYGAQGLDYKKVNHVGYSENEYFIL